MSPARRLSPLDPISHKLMGAAFLDFGREKAAEYHFRKAPVIPVLTPSIEPLGYAVDVER